MPASWNIPRAVALLAAALPLFGDLKIVTKCTVSGHVNVQTDFYKGDLFRSEYSNFVYIGDREHSRSVSLFPSRREYFVQPPGILHFEGFTVDKSRTYVVQTDTQDTGETKHQWGHIARRYITTRRERLEEFGKADSEWHETRIESWTLDVLPPESYHGSSHALAAVFTLAFHNSRPDVRVTHTGATPKGILVYEKTDAFELEVTDLSEAALDPKLFEVPPDYRRTNAPEPGPSTWDEWLSYYWRQMQMWVSGLFS